MRFSISYFLLAVFIFLTEVFIAIYVHDRFIRPFGGDILVVVLIYAFVLAFFDFPRIKTAVGVLLFAFLIETLQYFDICTRLGLQDQRWARVVIGTSFSWLDLLMYVIGFGMILVGEKISSASRNKP